MMSTEQRSDTDDFQSCLWNIYGAKTSGDALDKIRAKAWDQFLTKGLPTKDNDVFKYIRLRNLYAQKYTLPTTFDTPGKLPILPECQGSALVFVNGTFRPDLSKIEGLPKRAVVLPISEAVNTYGTFLNSQWNRTLKEEADPFALLNLSLQHEGLFLYLPPKTIFESPLQIIHLIDAKDQTLFINPRIHIFVGSQSELSVINTWHHISGEGYAINAVTDIAVEDNAHVKVVQSANEFPADAWLFDAIRVLQKRQSTFKSIAATNGAETVRQDYRVALTGEGAEASLNGVWMLSGKREAHTHILMDHQAPHADPCSSLKASSTTPADRALKGKSTSISSHKKQKRSS